MSWLSQHYEKITLGASITAMAALGFAGLKNKQAQVNAFTLLQAKPNNEIEVPLLSDVEDTKISIYEDHKINQADLDGRKVNLFTGIILYAKRDDPQNPVDLLKSEPIHAGIPNEWWRENKLDPGFANAPERDPDKDGFNNREEYEAETDPNDMTDYPEPVTKLGVKTVEWDQWHIKPKPVNSNGDISLFNLETPRKVRKNRTKFDKSVKVGGVITFEGPIMTERFRFADLGKRRNQNGSVDTIWVIEDLQPNKKGILYRFDSRGNLDPHANRDEGKGIMDYKAYLFLQALDKQDELFSVDENTRFSLPYDPEAAEKPYLLKNIDTVAREVTVEYTDKEGEKVEHLIKW